jgi:prepilin-type N-terminal cleavage/methylation domain-containing protein
MTSRTAGRGRAGFTLIESAAALLVLAAVVYVGALSFLHVLPQFRLRGAVWEITAMLNEARLTAILEGAAVRWRALPPRDGLWGFVLERLDPLDGSWKTILLRRATGVVLRANNTPTFHPRGTVSHLATIIVENRRGLYRITVAITGRVKAVKA